MNEIQMKIYEVIIDNEFASGLAIYCAENRKDLEVMLTNPDINPFYHDTTNFTTVVSELEINLMSKLQTTYKTSRLITYNRKMKIYKKSCCSHCHLLLL